MTLRERAAFQGEACLLLPPGACASSAPLGGRRVSLHGSAFATHWRLEAVVDGRATGAGLDRAIQRLRELCQAELDLIDRQMSPWRPDSDLVRFNSLTAGARMALPLPMREVVGRALELSDLTGGAFDPFLCEAVASWGFGPVAVAPGLPDPSRLYAMATARRTGTQAALEGDVLIRPDGPGLDLCGVAKGFAVDRVIDRLRRDGACLSAMFEIGGEVRAWGLRQDATPWWVDIDSFGPSVAGHGPGAVRLGLVDCAVATSGDANRAFVHEGRRLSHTLDPRTLEPVSGRLAAATVITPLCSVADALATALLVLGEDQALAFAASHNLACMLVVRDAAEGAKLRFSPALEAWREDAQ